MANIFGCDWELLAKYAKGLRDRVGKLLQREEGASAPAAFTDREAFILEDYRFLKEHLRRVSDSRKKRTSIGISHHPNTSEEPPPLPTMEGADEDRYTPNTSSSINMNRVSFIVSFYSTLL